jgi:peptidoglycan/xylan/chitin deacetylase (PgdA/CDA1 family)
MPLSVESCIYGKYNGEFYGIPKIMDICGEKGVKATFFVDVYAYRVFGEQVMKQVCQDIKERGHDVQLHAHANWIYPHKSEYMWAYSLKEQSEIIKEGRELIHKWTGEYPVAFRAGAYGANYDTLKALSDNSINIDSSMFYKHHLCKLNSRGLTRNKIVTENNVIEVPVTTFIGFKCASFIRYSKLDINARSFGELKEIILKAKKRNLKTIILFLHSFSFLKWSRDRKVTSPDLEAIDILSQTIDLLKSYQIEILTMREFHNEYKENPDKFIGEDVLPELSFKKISSSLIRKTQRLILD